MKRFILALLVIASVYVSAQAAQMVFVWNPVTTNSDSTAITDLAGYKILQSTYSFQSISGVWASTTTAMADLNMRTYLVPGSTTTFAAPQFPENQWEYFRLVAYDTNGNTSGFNTDDAGIDQQIAVMVVIPPSAPKGFKPR